MRYQDLGTEESVLPAGGGAGLPAPTRTIEAADDGTYGQCIFDRFIRLDQAHFLPSKSRAQSLDSLAYRARSSFIRTAIPLSDLSPAKSPAPQHMMARHHPAPLEMEQREQQQQEEADGYGDDDNGDDGACAGRKRPPQRHHRRASSSSLSSAAAAGMSSAFCATYPFKRLFFKSECVTT
jgi:hypothetical protein